MAREQERAELHRTIWQIANDLRGSVDGWDFKNYVLDVEIDSKNLYTLSLEDGCYFKKVYDKKGKLKKTLLIPSVYNSYQLEISGLCRINGKVHVMAFYFDGENHTMVLF